MVKYLDNNSGFRQWNAAQSAQRRGGGMSGFLWWLVVFFAAWWLIGTWMGNKTQAPAADAAPSAEMDVSAVPVTTLESDKISAAVQGLRIRDVRLADFAVSASDNARVSLLDSDGAFAEFGLISAGTSAPTPATVWNVADGVYSWRNSDGVVFDRRVSVDGYVITVADTVRNNTARDISVTPYARIVRGADKHASAGVSTGAVAYVNSDIERVDWRRLAKKSYAYTTVSGFVGFADQYWETLVDIAHPDQTIRVKHSGDMYWADVSAAAVAVAPGTDATITTYLYAGPRERGALVAASNDIPGAQRTMDYGWFGFLARPLLWVLNTLNALVMNYGIAIILLTIALRLVLWPLTRKSYASMMAMQQMQPEMARIQKLYANDKMRLQMEMMKLYKTHHTSPMSGCLPMLIQIPIFFALYKALLISVQMRSAHFLWISDLAAMDPYFIMPALMGVTMWLQQYLQGASKKSGTASDAIAQTQRMMRWIPLLFTIMFAWMPAGLVLYWTVSNMFGIVQMYIIRRRMSK